MAGGLTVAQRRQMSLLDWVPPQPVAAFSPRLVAASTIAGQVARAVSVALAECGQARDAVAEAMSRVLGRKISKPMLDAYASTARDDHAISVERFAALLRVTRDRRLLELLAEPMGWAVIERRDLALLELAAVEVHRNEMRRVADGLRRQVRSRGVR